MFSSLRWLLGSTRLMAGHGDIKSSVCLLNSCWQTGLSNIGVKQDPEWRFCSSRISLASGGILMEYRPPNFDRRVSEFPLMAVLILILLSMGKAFWIALPVSLIGRVWLKGVKNGVWWSVSRKSGFEQGWSNSLPAANSIMASNTAPACQPSPVLQGTLLPAPQCHCPQSPELPLFLVWVLQLLHSLLAHHPADSTQVCWFIVEPQGSPHGCAVGGSESLNIWPQSS